MCATHCSKFIYSQGLGHRQQVSHQARITAIATQSWQVKNYAPLTLVEGRLRLLTACFRCKRLRPHHLSDRRRYQALHYYLARTACQFL